MIRSSVLSYPQRGPYGDHKFRGNVPRLLVRDLIRHFGATSVLDPMAGSYTTRDVCRELGVDCDCFDLRDGFDVLTSPLPDKRYDLIFIHPPYMNMIRYSRDPRDLSNVSKLDEYMKKLSETVLRLAHYLTREGYIIIVIGNRRKNGRLYPLGAWLEVLFMRELKEELIKIQHNVMSQRFGNGFKYANSNFIPIKHEKILVLTGFKTIRWQDLLARALKELGGEAHVQELYSELEGHPKTADNMNWRAAIRHDLQRNFTANGDGRWAL